MSFILHPQLTADSFHVGNLPLCRLLLMNNANFPWLILVPERPHLRELFDLSPAEYSIVMQEIRMVGESFQKFTAAHKINIAALGNVVPQLHIHIIARFDDDVAWPSPVWGHGAPRPYNSNDSEKIISEIRALLGLN